MDLRIVAADGRAAARIEIDVGDLVVERRADKIEAAPVARHGGIAANANALGVSARGATEGDDDDRWVAIAVHDDEDWRRFRQAIGNPGWAGDARFATAAGRLTHVDELEDKVTAWTRERPAKEVMTTLQAAGIDAGVVQNFEDLNRDPQLAHREHFREVEHPVIGKHLCEMMAMRFSETPGNIRAPAPCLGEHGEYVYRELLGMSADEYAALEKEGVFA